MCHRLNMVGGLVNKPIQRKIKKKVADHTRKKTAKAPAANCKLVWSKCLDNVSIRCTHQIQKDEELLALYIKPVRKE